MTTRDDNTNAFAGTSNGPGAGNPRRRLLVALTVGGATGAALPASWSKPVVESILLPAHAEMTTVVVNGAGGGPVETTSAPSGQSDMLDFFIDSAHAAGAVTSFCVAIVVQEIDNVVTGVTVSQTCYNSCDSGRWFDQTTGTVNLSFDSPNNRWTGIVGTDNHTINVFNIDTSSATKLADVDLNGVSGQIEPDGSCNCDCEPGGP